MHGERLLVAVCLKCGGEGKFIRGSRDYGDCYECRGTGQVYETVPANQSKHPALRAQRERDAQEKEEPKYSSEEEVKAHFKNIWRILRT